MLKVCDICKAGYVLYKVHTEQDYIADYVARCTCQKGSELGPGIPTIVDLGLDPGLLRQLKAQKGELHRDKAETQ